MRNRQKIQRVSEPVRLGVWGVSESGKTVYLAKLYRVLREQGWMVFLDGDYTEFNEEAIRKLDRRELPNPTNLKGEFANVYTFHISNDDFQGTGRQVEAVLDFIDIGGEYYEGDSSYRKELKIKLDNQEITLIDYFLNCQGILFLLDYWRDQKDLKYKDKQFTLLEDLFREMYERQKERNQLTSQEQNKKLKSIRKLEPYVAFGVTKADHDDIRNSGLSSIRLVSNVLGLYKDTIIINWFYGHFHVDKSKLEQQIETGYYQNPSKFHRCQFYSISAIGIYFDEQSGGWRSGLIEPPKNQDNNSQDQTKDQDSNPGSVFDTTEDKIPRYSKPSDRFRQPPKPNNYEERKPKPQIVKGVELETCNVIEPIEWFIEGILNYPPDLPTNPSETSGST